MVIAPRAAQNLSAGRGNAGDDPGISPTRGAWLSATNDPRSTGAQRTGGDVSIHFRAGQRGAPRRPAEQPRDSPTSTRRPAPGTTGSRCWSRWRRVSCRHALRLRPRRGGNILGTRNELMSQRDYFTAVIEMARAEETGQRPRTDSRRSRCCRSSSTSAARSRAWAWRLELLRRTHEDGLIGEVSSVYSAWLSDPPPPERTDAMSMVKGTYRDFVGKGSCDRSRRPA